MAEMNKKKKKKATKMNDDDNSSSSKKRRKRRRMRKRRPLRFLVKLQFVWNSPDSYCQSQNGSPQNLQKGERKSRTIKFFLNRSAYRRLLRW